MEAKTNSTMKHVNKRSCSIVLKDLHNNHSNFQLYFKQTMGPWVDRRCMFYLSLVISCFFLFVMVSLLGFRSIKDLIPQPVVQQQVEESLQRPVIILFWTSFWGQTPPINRAPFLYVGDNCPVKCVLTTDKKRFNEASALLIYAPNAGERPATKQNKTWILYTHEQHRYAPVLRDATVMAMFNYLMSYRLDCDFPAPMFLKPPLDKPIPFEEKNGLVMVALSNCEKVRTRYIAELMKNIQVDSYGGCLKNKDTLSGRRSPNAFNDVKELQRKYKFSLIFPNADCDYYLTEKIGNALSAGSVPVFMGTDKIDEVLQWGNLKHSYIKVKDFASPEKLAEYLKHLAQNKTEYNKFLKWKYEGFQFPKEYYKSPIGEWWDGPPLFCRVCMKIAKDPKGHNGLPADKCDGNQTRTLAKWKLTE